MAMLLGAGDHLSSFARLAPGFLSGIVGQEYLAGGFYIVCEMKLCSEDLFAKRYDFGCNFWDREGRSKSYNPNCTV